MQMAYRDKKGSKFCNAWGKGENTMHFSIHTAAFVAKYAFTCSKLTGSRLARFLQIFFINREVNTDK